MELSSVFLPIPVDAQIALFWITIPLSIILKRVKNVWPDNSGKVIHLNRSRHNRSSREQDHTFGFHQKRDKVPRSLAVPTFQKMRLIRDANFKIPSQKCSGQPICNIITDDINLATRI